MRNDPYFHVGYAPKINSGSTHNIKFQKKFSHCSSTTERVAHNRWLRFITWDTGFLKFYVMGATGIDFVDIVHVKVGVIAHQKIYLGVPCLMGGNFVWDLRFEQCDWGAQLLEFFSVEAIEWSLSLPEIYWGRLL